MDAQTHSEGRWGTLALREIHISSCPKFSRGKNIKGKERHKFKDRFVPKQAACSDLTTTHGLMVLAQLLLNSPSDHRGSRSASAKHWLHVKSVCEREAGN